MQPRDALDRIAFLLERIEAPTYRVQAFRKAIATLATIDDDELRRLDRLGQLKALPGIGDKTATVISQSLADVVPDYLADLEKDRWPVAEVDSKAQGIRDALIGDCHTHSLWSDGGSSISDMARTAQQLGHRYIVVTDHSPRLTVANGLTAQRLEQQLEEIAVLNRQLAAEGADGFQVRTGIEVDINEDGSLDQDPELLERLDSVVASVHSKLRMERLGMTRRMIAAIENPHTAILGHCTGRKVEGKSRPQSEFDAKAVFGACIEAGVAVEINCRPARTDPPEDLLRLAADMGCSFAINTDAHAPGQLDMQILGCIRAAEIGIEPSQIINT